MKKIGQTLALGMLGLMTSASVNAALLMNISSEGVGVTSADLSVEGDTNWSAWDVRNSTTSAAIAATSHKASGSGNISDVTVFTDGGGTEVRGTSSLDNYSDVFSWSAADASGGMTAPADGILSGLFNSSLNTLGNGVQVSITDLAVLSGSQSYEIKVYTTSFRASGLFSADINGGSAITQNGATYDTNKYTQAYTIGYNPDLFSDALNLSFSINSMGGAGSSHVAIQAVTVSVVPEASSILMLGAGISVLLLSGLFRRRF